MVSDSNRMGMIKLLFSTLLVLSALANVRAQEVQLPTEAEVAASKRRYEILRHPTGIITLRLAALDREPATTPPRYHPYDRMEFRLFITQSSGEDLIIEDDRDAYYAYRSELIRDGDIVSYTKDAQDFVARAEREPWGNGFTRAPSKLVSGQEYQDHYVNLEDWYESPLKPGHYQLTVRKQFVPGGDWLESNPVTFDVIASESPDRQSPSEQPHLKLILNDAKKSMCLAMLLDFNKRWRMNRMDR